MTRIGRRIYYDTITGDIILALGERVGNVIDTTIEEDMMRFKVLNERTPNTVGCLQLEYGQYAQEFAKCDGFRVNLNSLELEFTYPALEEETQDYFNPYEQRLSDLEIAIAAILGGAV